ALRDQVLNVAGLRLRRRLGVVGDVLAAGGGDGGLDGGLIPLGPAFFLIVVPRHADGAAGGTRASCCARGGAPRPRPGRGGARCRCTRGRGGGRGRCRRCFCGGRRTAAVVAATRGKDHRQPDTCGCNAPNPHPHAFPHAHVPPELVISRCVLLGRLGPSD